MDPHDRRLAGLQVEVAGLAVHQVPHRAARQSHQPTDPGLLAVVDAPHPGRQPQQPQPGGVPGLVLRREVGVVVEDPAVHVAEELQGDVAEGMRGAGEDDRRLCEKRSEAGIDASDADLLANPYLLFERDRINPSPVSVWPPILNVPSVWLTPAPPAVSDSTVEFASTVVA